MRRQLCTQTAPLATERPPALVAGVRFGVLKLHVHGSGRVGRSQREVLLDCSGEHLVALRIETRCSGTSHNSEQECQQPIRAGTVPSQQLLRQDRTEQQHTL